MSHLEKFHSRMGIIESTTLNFNELQYKIFELGDLISTRDLIALTKLNRYVNPRPKLKLVEKERHSGQRIEAPWNRKVA